MQVQVPRRAAHSSRLQLDGSPARVFELLCPVRECDWIEGWEPLCVISESGLAEPDAVFTTAASPYPAVWFITRHDAVRGAIEMIKITPALTACKLTIHLHDSAGGCAADVSYAHTSLAPQGDRFVDGFNAAVYADFMCDWEDRLNHYLRTGSMLRSRPRAT